MYTFKNSIFGSPSLMGDIPYLTEIGDIAALKRNGLHASVFVSYGVLEQELGMQVKN